MKNIVFPDYNRSILNNMASVMKYYGVQTDYSTLPEVDEALAKKYKNIVFMVFDGMGVDMLQKNLASTNFLNKHMVCDVTSVYPSTTTAAMTSYYAGVSPNEHGWLGWSLYFKEYGRCIDAFLNTDSYSGELLEGDYASYSMMPYTMILDTIEEVTENKIATYMMQPNYLMYRGKGRNVGVASVEDISKNVVELCRQEDEKFIFVYWNDPDKTMHSTGCYSKETKSVVKQINDEIAKMSECLDDTLVIISADHGLIDIEETIALNEIEELDECFTMPPFIEKRGMSFFIKPEMKELFKIRFEKRFSKDFILLTKEEVFDKELLGKGISHHKTKDFIGDYLACGITNKMIDYVPRTSKGKLEIPAMHAGLTFEEMVVPIIMIERKK
ncbi:MAG: alkaline phosphatase family protein [Turicibacter sp.]